MSKAPVLDLSEALGHDTAKLKDGTTVEFRNPVELGPLEEFQFRGLLAAINGYDPSKVKTEQEALEASEKLHKLAAMITVDLPEDVDDGSCAALFTFWIQKHAVAEGNPQTPPRTRTGAKSSRASKRSTAATRRAGSGSRSGR